MNKPSQPKMHDPKDVDLHSPKGKPPYPEPDKTKVEINASGDDLADPGDTDAHAPHDRGGDRNGHYEDAVDSMNRKVGQDAAERRRKQEDR